MLGEAIALTVAAPAVTKAVDFLRNAFGRFVPDTQKWVWNVSAVAVGILGCLTFNIEPVELPKALRFEVSGTMLQVATGFVLGGIASGWHEIFHLWASKAHRG